MLFNSYAFIFVFLPLTLIGFFGLAALRLRVAAIAWLVLTSLVFYSYWNTRYVALLAGSMVFNYWVGQCLKRTKPAGIGAKWLLALGVASNLVLLGYFKYANFFLQAVDHLIATGLPFTHVALPLGISFFTFTQIAYLVDAYRSESREQDTFADYCLFVTFFPHLIAGPILYHKDIIPQFHQQHLLVYSHKNMAEGLLTFSFGVFKKVVIADNLAEWVRPVFNRVSEATMIDAWVGALAYTLQLYFDFSGYSDMAIGLGLMFNIRLPLNFNSPYKSTSVIEFWKRWHMTLAWFLKNYLYIPLGGNRLGEARRMGNLLVTMLLGGLWHGAGWTYVLWGGMHGVFLAINHAWRKLNVALPGIVSWPLTFCAVVTGWVLFRAHSVEDAVVILKTMGGYKGLDLPRKFEPLFSGLTECGVRFSDSFILSHGIDHLGGLMILLTLTGVLPNTQELVGRFRPTWIWMLAGAAAAGSALLSLNKASEFLYFQF
jgi:alginate O-acetyltransferase complex protein AlgI